MAPPSLRKGPQRCLLEDHRKPVRTAEVGVKAEAFTRFVSSAIGERTKGRWTGGKNALTQKGARKGSVAPLTEGGGCAEGRTAPVTETGSKSGAGHRNGSGERGARTALVTEIETETEAASGEGRVPIAHAGGGH